MTAYIVRRLAQGLLVIIFVTLLVFVLLHLLPSDPVSLYLSATEKTRLDPQQLEAIRHQFGLDKPLPVQYLNWISGVIRGDLGTSFYLHEKVSRIIGRTLPVSLYLGSLAFIVSCFCGVTFGIICAIRRGKWLDSFFTFLAHTGVAAPPFLVGILLIYLLALNLKLLPVFGYTSPLDDFWLSIRQMIMPVICLSVGPTAVITRQTRSSILETIRQDYVRTGWSKGLSERTVILKHVLKNAFVPIITVMGLIVSGIVAGAVIIETVFSIPGIGQMMIKGVEGQDFQVVQGGVLVIATIVVLANLVTDISYGWFDPRIRYQ